MSDGNGELKSVLDDTFGVLDEALGTHEAELRAEEVGTLTYVGRGIARVAGLGAVRSEELLRFAGDLYGMYNGYVIRRGFIPAQAGWLFLAADYSQIELRLLAHVSGDHSLVHAFRNNIDIHRLTAAKVEEAVAALRDPANATEAYFQAELLFSAVTGGARWRRGRSAPPPDTSTGSRRNGRSRARAPSPGLADLLDASENPDSLPPQLSPATRSLLEPVRQKIQTALQRDTLEPTGEPKA